MAQKPFFQTQGKWPFDGFPLWISNAETFGIGLLCYCTVAAHVLQALSASAMTTRATGHPQQRPTANPADGVQVVTPVRRGRPPGNSTNEGARRAERFVLRSHIVPLLDVIIENRKSYDDVIEGRTHAGKYSARVKLVQKLIEKDESTRPCFGSDAEIMRQNGTNEKIKDILRVLKNRYINAMTIVNSPGAGPEEVTKALEGFGGINYQEAKRKADLVFRQSAASTVSDVNVNTDAGTVSAQDDEAELGEMRSSASEDGNMAEKDISAKQEVTESGDIINKDKEAVERKVATRIAKKGPGRGSASKNEKGKRQVTLADRRDKLEKVISSYFVSLAKERQEMNGDAEYGAGDTTVEAQARASLVEEKMRQERTKFGIEIYSNTHLPVKVRVTLLRKHNCDELANALENEDVNVNGVP